MNLVAHKRRADGGVLRVLKADGIEVEKSLAGANPKHAVGCTIETPDAPADAVLIQAEKLTGIELPLVSVGVHESEEGCAPHPSRCRRISHQSSDVAGIHWAVA